MKFAHLSDLHLGLKMNGLNIEEDQRFILQQIVEALQEENVDAVLIAGDIYDSSQPSRSAVDLYSWFLTKLKELGRPVLVIPGNHDNAVLLSFASDIFAREQIHVAPSFDGQLRQVTLSDAWGDVCFTLLPYVKPFVVAAALDAHPKTWTEAVKMALAAGRFDQSARQVVLTHQFITYQNQYDGIPLSLERGGLNNVDVSVYDKFDYVAAGHIHRAEKVGSFETIRYCGSPLAYSKANVNYPPSFPVVTLKEKGTPATISLHTLRPLHAVRAVKDTFAALMRRGEEQGVCEDFLYVTLTDPELVEDGKARLNRYFPNIIELQYANAGKLSGGSDTADRLKGKSPWDLTQEFFARQEGLLSPERKKYLSQVFEQVREDVQ